jgi:hypothetical protein
MSDTPALPAALIVAGGYLAWFGVHYWRTDVAWPSDPVKAVLTGKPIPAAGPDKLRDMPLGRPLTIAPTPTTSAIDTASGGLLGGARVMSKTEIQNLWTTAGGNPAAADTAAAIALAESSGRTDALSQNPDGGTNVGLWQLDTRGVGSGYSVEQLRDPATNARVTVMGSLNGANWGPWQTYVEGTYRKYL